MLIESQGVKKSSFLTDSLSDSLNFTVAVNSMSENTKNTFSTTVSNLSVCIT